MTSVSFPTYTGPDLFANYRPSANAHTDIISPSGGSGQVKTVKTIKLTLKTQFSQPTSKDLLSILLPSISLILAGKRTEPSFRHLSSACHRLVLPPLAVGPTIYLRVNEELTQSVTGLAREWRGSIMGREAGWLGRLVEGTKGWEKRVSLLSAVLVYLDRVYCNESTGIASIKELAIVTFRKGIWENQLLFQKTRDDLLSWASGEREAGATNADLRPTIQSITALSKLLGAFTSLSAPYLEDLTSYYTKLAELKLSEVDKGEMSPSRYVQWLLERVEEERERGKTCFDDEVAERAVESVREELGTKIQERIVRRALDEAMDLVDSQALSRLFRFSVDTHVFTTFNKALQDYIETRLRKLISDPKNDPQMIEETLKLKKFTDKAVTELFIPAKTGAPEFSTGDTAKSETTSPNKVSAVHPETSKPIPSLKIGAEDDVKEDPKPINGRGEDDEDKMELDDMEHPNDANPEEELIDETEEVILPPLDRSRQLELQDAVRAGFKAGMGSRQNAPAEWIAKHLDQVMRRGQGSGTESAFNALLDEIIALIGFTRDKDVFKAFYSSQLAKRLLLNKSASNDMERNMIVKLQKEMGEEFTTGDVMMKDLGLSETLVKTYQSHLSKSSLPDPTNLSANVLTESAWPAYPLLKDGWAFKLTPELQSSVDEFTKWYATQHKNRQLSWRWQLATVTLTGRFGGGRYEIGVSLFQAVVLLQFNEVDELDFKEIKERTGIESSELIRTLQSLSIGRKGTRVLLKRPPVKEVLPTDTFRYHKSFTSDRLKFRINQIQQDMSAEESQKTNEQVAIDRVSVLEATIVRIMKGKKKLTLAGLIDAVVGEVSRRFPPDVREIKRRVESLIEREFLMRDEEDRNLLHYLA